MNFSSIPVPLPDQTQPWDLSKIYTFFDTETSGMINFKARNRDESQPWIAQLAVVTTDRNGRVLHSNLCVLHSEGRPMDYEAEQVHGVPMAVCIEAGLPPADAIQSVLPQFAQADHIIAHNKNFDLRILCIAAGRASKSLMDFYYKMKDDEAERTICTMNSTTKLCQLPKPSGKGSTSKVF